MSYLTIETLKRKYHAKSFPDGRFYEWFIRSIADQTYYKNDYIGIVQRIGTFDIPYDSVKNTSVGISIICKV